MQKYVINKNQQANGDHEVHNASIGCSYMPNPENQIDLGSHASCHGAIAYAKRQYPSLKIDGCYHCCSACHTS
jgi:hypothetical protein